MSDQVRSFKDLEVWQVAIALAEAIYAATAKYPRDEMFGMTSQMRRASVSIAANIAEGWGRESTQNFINFLRIAQGSLKELETHIVISQRVKLLEALVASELQSQCDSISRMLRSLIRTLEAKKDG